jgi:hypothetical protein
MPANNRLVARISSDVVRRGHGKLSGKLSGRLNQLEWSAKALAKTYDDLQVTIITMYVLDKVNNEMAS